MTEPTREAQQLLKGVHFATDGDYDNAVDYVALYIHATKAQLAGMIPRADVEAAVEKVEALETIHGADYYDPPLLDRSEVLAILDELAPKPEPTQAERLADAMLDLLDTNMHGAEAVQAALDKLGLELVAKGDAE